MSNPQIPGRATYSQTGGHARPNTFPVARKTLENPEATAFFAAFGLVMIAAVVAFIIGIAQEANRTE